jgi:hypothetical protein
VGRQDGDRSAVSPQYIKEVIIQATFDKTFMGVDQIVKPTLHRTTLDAREREAPCSRGAINNAAYTPTYTGLSQLAKRRVRTCMCVCSNIIVLNGCKILTLIHKPFKIIARQGSFYCWSTIERPLDDGN